MNLANAATMSRIVLAPVFLLAAYLDRFRGGADSMTGWAWVAVCVFAFAACTDLIDGVIARRNNTITDLGKLLDPVADKVLVGAALIGLVAFRGFPLWAAAVIALREVIVTALRGVALSRGRVIPAATGGKIKTATQIPMVLVWMFPRTAAVAYLQDLLVWVAVVLTVVSGAAYLTAPFLPNARRAGS